MRGVAAAVLLQQAQAAPSPQPFNLGKIVNKVANVFKDAVGCATKGGLPASAASKVSTCTSNKNPYLFAACAGVKNVGTAQSIIRCMGR